MPAVVSTAPVGRRVEEVQIVLPSGQAVSRTHSSTCNVVEVPTVSTLAQRGSQMPDAQSAFTVQTQESPIAPEPAPAVQTKRATGPLAPLPRHPAVVFTISPRITPAPVKLAPVSVRYPPFVLNVPVVPVTFAVSTRTKLPAAAAQGDAPPASQRPAKLAAVSTSPVPL